MNEGAPTWRVDKDRGRIEEECEERAHDEALGIITDEFRLGGLLCDLDGDDLLIIAVWIRDLCLRPGRTTACILRDKVLDIAYRRALAAERRKEGLE